MIEISQPAGPSRLTSVAEFVGELHGARATVTASFAAERLELVAAVSARILRGGVRQTSPGVTHFAYWTRRQALKALTSDAVLRLPKYCIARPRGLVFHLPPQNVETVFLYSWVISYLAGNANLTRLPAELGTDMARLLALFQGALAETGDHGQFFVRYPVTEETNRALSAASDARVVWGGDVKVETFSKLPLRRGGKSIWFGDRRSLAMIDGGAIDQLGADGRRALAERLYNDIFVFDQMACSSPVRLFVVGAEAAHGGSVDDLLDALSRVALTRAEQPATGHVIRKMVASMAAASNGAARRVMRHSNMLTTLLTERPGEYFAVGGGFLEVIYVDSPSVIYGSLEENVQTIVHAGFELDQLTAFATGLPAFGVSRIVPVGQALDFDAVWDGYDLFGELTQLLRVW